MINTSQSSALHGGGRWGQVRPRHHCPDRCPAGHHREALRLAPRGHVDDDVRLEPLRDVPVAPQKGARWKKKLSTFRGWRPPWILSRWFSMLSDISVAQTHRYRYVCAGTLQSIDSTRECTASRQPDTIAYRFQPGPIFYTVPYRSTSEYPTQF